MDINQQISTLITSFEQEKSRLKLGFLPIISFPSFYNDYDGTTSFSELIRDLSTAGMTPELIQAQEQLFQHAMAFENNISEVNNARILLNEQKQKEIEVLADAFYLEAKNLLAQLPTVLKENASITFPVKRLEGNLEQILIASFIELKLPFEKKGNLYHGYYFSSKKSHTEKSETVNFQKFENIKKKLSILIEIKTDGKFPDASRYMTNNFISDSIFRFETAEQEKLNDMVKMGVEWLYY